MFLFLKEDGSANLQTPGKGAPDTYSVGGWVEPRASLDPWQKREISALVRSENVVQDDPRQPDIFKINSYQLFFK